MLRRCFWASSLLWAQRTAQIYTQYMNDTEYRKNGWRTRGHINGDEGKLYLIKQAQPSLPTWELSSGAPNPIMLPRPRPDVLPTPYGPEWLCFFILFYHCYCYQRQHFISFFCCFSPAPCLYSFFSHVVFTLLHIYTDWQTETYPILPHTQTHSYPQTPYQESIFFFKP